MDAIFNDGSEEFKDQCIAFRRVCPICGSSFDDTDKICTKCNNNRERCHNKAMTNEQHCRVHSEARVLSIYNVVAGKLSDTTLDELIEKGNLRDLTIEFALAKLAIAEMHSSSATGKDRIEAIATLFSIAEKLQRIESGGLLNVNWADPLVLAMRNKFRSLIGTMVDIIEKYVIDVPIRKLMIQELQDRSKLIGNSITIKPVEGNVDEILALRTPTNSKLIDSREIDD